MKITCKKRLSPPGACPAGGDNFILCHEDPVYDCVVMGCSGPGAVSVLRRELDFTGMPFSTTLMPLGGYIEISHEVFAYALDLGLQDNMRQLGYPLRLSSALRVRYLRRA